MGGQRHADGSHSIIFSIWDQCKRYGSTDCIVKNETAIPLGKCSRFGGEGHGAHCDGQIEFEPGRPYAFRVAVGAANATGRTISVRPARPAACHGISVRTAPPPAAPPLPQRYG